MIGLAHRQPCQCFATGHVYSVPKWPCLDSRDIPGLSGGRVGTFSQKNLFFRPSVAEIMCPKADRKLHYRFEWELKILKTWPTFGGSTHLISRVFFASKSSRNNNLLGVATPNGQKKIQDLEFARGCRDFPCNGQPLGAGAHAAEPG